MMAIMRSINSCLVLLCCIGLFEFFGTKASNVGNTLKPGHVMGMGEYLESFNKKFRLQFLKDSLSDYGCLVIQYMGRNAESTVWVANQLDPQYYYTSVLNFTLDGYLVIDDGYGSFVQLNIEQPGMSSDTSATLEDSGNFVLREGELILWQSSDNPTTTLLPGMKLGLFDLNSRKPQKQFLTSWTSLEVLNAGLFALGVDPNNTKQLVVWKRNEVYWRSETWNGQNFSSLLGIQKDIGYNLSYFSNENESYFIFLVDENIYLPLLQIDWRGQIVLLSENNLTINLAPSKCKDGDVFSETRGYMNGWYTIDDYSLVLSECAEICQSNCSCHAFTYGTIYQTGCRISQASQGYMIDGSGETLFIRKINLSEQSKCKGGDAFSRTQGLMNGWYNVDNLYLSLNDCAEMCQTNCSCNAYTYASISQAGCKFAQASQGYKIDGSGEIFFIRKSILVDHSKRKACLLWFKIGGSLLPLTVMTIISLYCCLKRKKCSSREWRKDGLEWSIEEHGLHLFSFSRIEIATDNFSDANKLGHDGFGPIYKGKLVKGKEIAVKRLSRSSTQGVEEFKNEIILISNLQHCNLVKLLSYCSQGDEKLLIYEYLPNKSLDVFLFDATKRAFLDWKTRICIIDGIARGLLYLHKYSRLKIIHRDLKISNILLDSNMKPKISDFGRAKIFGENESGASTNRIVGTYGYMPPEYAMDGHFSVKSDVFSFGVMMLEIISGKKNNCFDQFDHSVNLIGYAWDLWKEKRGSELMDPVLVETCSMSEVIRLVQVGLLCVQKSAADRRTILDVVSMLTNESMALPAPKQPAFSAIISWNDAGLTKNPPCSINSVTISEMEA